MINTLWNKERAKSDHQIQSRKTKKYHNTRLRGKLIPRYRNKLNQDLLDVTIPLKR